MNQCICCIVNLRSAPTDRASFNPAAGPLEGGDNFGSRSLQCCSCESRFGPRSALLRRCGLRCLPPEAKGVELRCGHHADKPRDSVSVRPAEVRRHREKVADLEHTAASFTTTTDRQTDRQTAKLARTCTR
eukprot:scaffold30293_cov61-Phaeocystis_antarctica.AAC.1